MRRLALFLGAGLAACSLDVTEPGFPRPANAKDVIVDFCWSDLPNWVAIKNEGQGWQIVSRNVRQRNVIAVSPKVIVAYGVTFLPSFSQVKVLFLTADELAEARCGSVIGNKILYANVAGVSANDDVFATIASGSGRTDPCSQGACRFGSPTQVRIEGVAEGPVDMLAYRIAQTGGRPQYVLRHGIDAPDGSLIGPIDFGTTEAVFTNRFPMTLGANVNASVFARFWSDRGTMRDLGMTSVTSGSGEYMALPPAVLASGDLHRQAALTSDGRFVATYVSSLGPLHMDVGPALSAPTVSQVDSDSVVRMRAVFPVQPEYADFGVATFYQGTFQQRQLSVVVSRGYLGGSPAQPAQWEIEVPEMPFLNVLVQLQPGVETAWQTEAWNSAAALFFGDRNAVQGAIVRCATATSDASLLARGCRTPLMINAPDGPAETSLLSP